MTARTTQLIGMILITVIKMVNATFRMAVEAVDLLNQMTGIIRNNKNNRAMMNMLIVLLMTKLADVLAGNGIAFAVDVLKVVIRLISTVEVVEGLTLIMILVTYLKGGLNGLSVDLNGNGYTSRMTKGSVLAGISITENVVAIKTRIAFLSAGIPLQNHEYRSTDISGIHL